MCYRRSYLIWPSAIIFGRKHRRRFTSERVCCIILPIACCMHGTAAHHTNINSSTRRTVEYQEQPTCRTTNNSVPRRAPRRPARGKRRDGEVYTNNRNSEKAISFTLKLLKNAPLFLPLALFKAAVPFRGQTSQILSSLSPKRDCGPKRVSVGLILFSPLTLFKAAVPFRGQTSQFLSSLPPKRDCGPKRV